jgi:hypothetical protein
MPPLNALAVSSKDDDEPENQGARRHLHCMDTLFPWIRGSLTPTYLLLANAQAPPPPPAECREEVLLPYIGCWAETGYSKNLFVSTSQKFSFNIYVLPLLI